MARRCLPKSLKRDGAPNRRRRAARFDQFAPRPLIGVPGMTCRPLPFRVGRAKGRLDRDSLEHSESPALKENVFRYFFHQRVPLESGPSVPSINRRLLHILPTPKSRSRNTLSQTSQNSIPTYPHSFPSHFRPAYCASSPSPINLIALNTLVPF